MTSVDFTHFARATGFGTNGTLKYTSAVTPGFPLLVDATLETLGSAVQGAVLTTTP